MKRMTFIAVAAVLICLCSWITVPFTVPFTMQTFAVFCALQILGGADGLAAIGLYILLGTLGLPVFSGFNGGLGHLLGPTGGYIVGFLFSGIVYLLFEHLSASNAAARWISLVLGLTACYLIGTVWFVYVLGTRGTEYSFMAALGVCVIPFIIPDLAKITFSVAISSRVKKALENNS